MKKILSLALALILCLMAASALGEQPPTVYGTIAMEMVEPEGYQEAGLYTVFNNSQLNILYVDENVQLPLVLVLRITDADYAAAQQDTATYNAMVQDGLTLAGQMEGYAYLMFSVTDAASPDSFFRNVWGIDYAAQPETSKKGVEAALPLIAQAITTLRPISQSQAMAGAFSFTGTDVYGNAVPADIIAQKDVTVINVWATFCSPCIQEMPGLEKWHAELPDNVQIIGIVSDVWEGQDASAAKAILEQNSVHFTNLTANDSMSTLLGMCAYVPTTFLVDKNGQLIGEPIIGADVQGYINAVNAYLNQ